MRNTSSLLVLFVVTAAIIVGGISLLQVSNCTPHIDNVLEERNRESREYRAVDDKYGPRLLKPAVLGSIQVDIVESRLTDAPMENEKGGQV